MRSCPHAVYLMVLLAGLFVAAPAARAQDAELLTEPGAIAGTMEIEFKTRTTPDTSGEFVEGSPALNVQDKYTFTLSVAKTTELAGTIVRQPNIYSKTLRKLKQGAALGFDIKLSVLNPKDLKQKKQVGSWVGNLPIDTTSGAYNLAAGDRPLRISIDTTGAVKGFVDNFAGRLLGKAEKKDNLAEYTYKRAIGDKTVQITVKKTDPMRFEGIELAKGPVDTYPRTLVNGRLDFDYDTSNWLTDGIRFKYSLGGKDYEDVVTGTIKWVEDPNYKTNGKGQYEFNLRFNEDKYARAAGESAAFEKLSAEDAFFVVDDKVPCLTGTISYQDTLNPDGKVRTSKVTYNLNANKLTKQQVMNFCKLWLLCAGPTNDD